MKAFVLHDIGDLRFENVEIPKIKDDEVLVQVKAAGICGSDIPRIYKTGAYSHPLIPGHEFSGCVIKTNNNEKKWENKKVGIFPLIACNKCIPCKNKQYEMCRSYGYLGSRRNGGFAEYAAVPANNIIELPENVSFEEAAMLEPMAVAVHSIRRNNLQKQNNIVICGLGTIGLFILMFLLEAGFENIYVIGNKYFQKENAIKLGLSEKHYCDTKTTNISEWIKSKTNDNGADIFFECVGKNETIFQAVNNTAPAGKVILVGNPYSDITFEKSLYWKILRNQLTIMGTWNSSFTHNINDDWHYVLDKLKNKLISPAILISHKFNIDELEKGFNIMRDKTEDYIKIIAMFE